MSRLPNKSDADVPVRPRRTRIKEWLTYETMSPAGQELMDIAIEIEDSDAPALDEAAVERELRTRRGGHVDDD